MAEDPGTLLPRPGANRTIGVALPVPEPYGSYLRERRASFGDPMAELVPTHVTLLPPTDVLEDDLEAVDKHLAAVAQQHAPFRIHLRGTATFRPVSPVVFVAIVAGISQCEVLSADVRSGPLQVELAYPYHPHITVAHHLDDDALDDAFDSLAAFHARIDVDAFALYEHGDDGFWRAERTYPLVGPPVETVR